MRTGLDLLLAAPDDFIRGRRFALLMNEASVDAELRYACDVVAESQAACLRSIWTPQHGLWGEQQANMIETDHTVHSELGVPVFSLYSETRAPTDSMLDDIELLLIDLQDVGCRVYTYIWTIANCLAACAEREVQVIVLDRPNPIGPLVRGPHVEPEYFSFVGNAEIPLQHGLSIGELAAVVRAQLGIEADLAVVPIEDWHRDQLWPDTQRHWVPTSPNLPTFESLQLYPGLVLLEGTNISEGRGTTNPFQIVGAPWIDGVKLAKRLEHHRGVRFRPTRFQPTFDKWQGQSCGGVFIHATSRAPDSVTLAIDLIAACKELWPDAFAWLPPPYEYEHHLMPIDILYGSSLLRERVDAGESATGLPDANAAAWADECEPHLLYEPAPSSDPAA